MHPEAGRPDDVRPAALRAVAETVAGEAAAFVRRRRAEVFAPAAATPIAVRAKSTPTDPVTVVDTETEDLLRRRLAELRPGDPVLGEEGGSERGAGAPDTITWVVDPIDGTVNFLYGIPAFAVSVAAQINGVSVAGAVADVAADTVYSAARGVGAHRRSAAGTEALHCSSATDLSLALLGTGFGYSAARRRGQADLLAQMLPRVRDVRRIGSAALDLCLVATGALDGFYEHGLNRWDWAAGALIAAEAGAQVVIPEPERTGEGAVVIAAAPAVSADLVDTLAEFGGMAPIAG
ncbi:inositol monophosphatase [Mycobacterium koreense]|uniref:inositol monophosphatase family protein n=1 Tax=Mycolicibacillus koreensis TaxID=1069220 RepID=UPI000848B73C|nr:inositol monophosphatase family protein [Mycolicibacillus koreensis]MCV7246868.1 inositol monophosphatase [Mycolicibacillus koreensis]ODR06965.1 inositol monophosphatase [Mycolicibacillus koreensis]BBY54264.1 inositol-1-monophosphatase SuhB [Mycolicibacillus koreensis]